MYIHNKLGYLLLLICLMYISQLDQPKELRKIEGKLFFLPYILNTNINTGCIVKWVLNTEQQMLSNESEGTLEH